MSKKWTKHDQALWDCIKIALDGLKRLEWLTDKEHKKITDILQSSIENKEESNPPTQEIK